MKASSNNTTAPPERRTISGAVLRLVPHVERKPAVCEQTVDHLEKLLAHAKTGRITGLAWVAVDGDRGYLCDTAGEAHSSPTWTRGALKALDDRLAARINAARFE